jgi:hypothetical protein
MCLEGEARHMRISDAAPFPEFYNINLVSYDLDDMENDIAVLKAALETIHQAPYHALVSCSTELYGVNLVIAEVLFSLSHGTRTSQKPPANYQKEISSAVDLNNNNTIYLGRDESTPWRTGPEDTIVSFAKHWLSSTELENRTKQDDLSLTLRKVVVASSPAVLKLVRKYFD